LHDKSPPRTRSLRLARQVQLRLVRGPGCTTRATPLMRKEGRISTSRKIQQLVAMQEARLAKSLNAGLTGRATITSPSSPSPPHARLNPRHSSTLYDAHEPRLRLGRGKLGHTKTSPNYSGRRPSVPEETVQPGHATVSRQGITTRLQCTPTDGNVRRDVPAAKHCNSFLLPLVPLPL
jgi:hypothetical protein